MLKLTVYLAHKNVICINTRNDYKNTSQRVSIKYANKAKKEVLKL